MRRRDNWLGFVDKIQLGRTHNKNNVYEIDIEESPPVDPFVLMSEVFDRPSSSFHVNTVGKEGTPDKKLLHAKAWLG